ncbi:hypothetical protein [Flavobacterium sp. NRK1]|uniref:hypothetical protein n=1 Tax=Flavobacterium sp. NRK1 TaxID=2954929 RepID=UPI0020920524|nr:hypothetical protein [Flavobacterium sp. NRK1]MCO6148606.1 hypothetical protein [Flavobacterium sp. NRK1]
MKRAIFFIVFLFSFCGFSQSEKDSLFAREACEIYNKLELMHHLDACIANYYLMTEEERIKSNQTFLYYYQRNIVGTCVFSSADILSYLEVYVEKDIPQGWSAFIDRVYNVNAKNLLALTDKYGYPSFNKIEKYAGKYDMPNFSIVFALRKNRYRKDIKKMIHKEYKKGNVTENEYLIFKAIAGKDVIAEKDVKKMKDMGVEFIYPK